MPFHQSGDGPSQVNPMRMLFKRCKITSHFREKRRNQLISSGQMPLPSLSRPVSQPSLPLSLTGLLSPLRMIETSQQPNGEGVVYAWMR